MRFTTVAVWRCISTEIFVCSESVGFVGKDKGLEWHVLILLLEPLSWWKTTLCPWNDPLESMAKPKCVITSSKVSKPPFISSRSYMNECTDGTSISETIVESFIIKVIKSSRIYLAYSVVVLLRYQNLPSRARQGFAEHQGNNKLVQKAKRQQSKSKWRR